MVEDSECSLLLESLSAKKRPPTSPGDILDKYGFGRYQYFVLITTSLARTVAFSHIILGTAVVSNQNTYWSLSLLEDRLVYTVLALCCLVGAVAGGKLADRHGRRALLLPGTLACSLSILVGSLTPHYYLFIVCSVVAGVAIGANLVLATALYTECVPSTQRSSSLLLLHTTTYLFNLVICSFTYLFLGVAGWRAHYALLALPPAIAFLLSFCLLTESPRFYGMVGHTEGQLYVLAKIRATNRVRFEWSLEEEMVEDGLVAERGSWKGLLSRSFGSVLTLSGTWFTCTAVLTAVTFVLPIMIAGRYCHLADLLENLHIETERSDDHFEYLLLSLIYSSLIFGSLLTHRFLTPRDTTSPTSLYTLFALLVPGLVTQMYCISGAVLLVGALATAAVVGGVIHTVSLLAVETFSPALRGTALGVLLGSAFLGTLFGPYVDVLIHVGSLKSVYIVFFVLGGTIVAMVPGTLKTRGSAGGVGEQKPSNEVGEMF